MELRWTADAANDLSLIADYLFEYAPQHAAELVQSIHAAPSKLLAFPHLGRTGKKASTRELVLSPLPYIVVYRVTADTIQVLRILHGSQRWP